MKTSTLNSKLATAVFAAIAAIAAHAVVPVIETSSVTVAQRPDRTVEINYTMTPATPGDTEPAIVTVDILTNAVGGVAASVGGEHLTTLSGDVNKVVSHTRDYKHKILWEPKDEGFPEFKLDAAQVTAKVTLWATNSPPAYWVIDLTQPTDRTADRYYPEVGQIPLGVTNTLYKTDRLVFRRIPAKGVTWKSGITNGANPARLHYVTFSYDYWMAVFETTKGQENHIDGLHEWGNESNSFPVVSMTYNNLRGTSTGSGDYNWPSNGHEKVGGRLAKWRTTLNGVPVDLPTFAEWQFACRAGTSTRYPWGDNSADYANFSWQTGNSESVVHPVGLKLPNNWGLYDMIGNRMEAVLDFFTRTDDTSPEWNPTGPKQDEIDVTWTGNEKWRKLFCGGSYLSSGAHSCTFSSTYRVNLTSNSAEQFNEFIGKSSQRYDQLGHRLCIVMP